MSRISFDAIRTRFLIAGFVVLFFVVGAARYGYLKVSGYLSRPSSGSVYPVGSLGWQIDKAQGKVK